MVSLSEKALRNLSQGLKEQIQETDTLSNDMW